MERLRNLLSASAWSVSGLVANQIVGFAILALLARHLDARQFGLVAVVVLMLDLTRELMLAGLPDYLVRKPQWDHELASSAFWLQVLIGTGFCLIGEMAGIALQALGLVDIGRVVMVLSPVYIIEAAAAMSQARLRHAMRFAPIAVAGTVAALAGGAASVAVVLAGGGYWALVAGRLVAAVASAAMLGLASGWWPGRPRLRGIGPALRFSAPLAGSRLLGMANVRATDLIVGFLGGPALLGAYQLAARPLNMVLQAFLGQVQTVALSALSPLDDPAAIRRSASAIMGGTALVVFPVASGLAAIAPEFIRIAFGPQWLGLAPAMAILMLACLPATVNYLLSPVLVKLDRPPVLVRFAGLVTAIAVVFTAAAAGAGLAAVATAFFARTFVGALRAATLLKRHAGIGYRDVARVLAFPLGGCAAIGCSVTVLRPVLAGTSDWNSAICLMLAGAAVYALAIAPLAMRHRGLLLQALRPAAN